MPEIGETLRETRMRRRIDMTEVEAATKIRAKYLRALENEEWDLLPGPTFVKTFLRTYAEYLDLDPRLLVEEYRQRFERPTTQDLTPFGPGMGAQRRRRQRQRRPIGPFVVMLLGDRRAARRAVPARRRLGRADPRTRSRQHRRHGRRRRRPPTADAQEEVVHARRRRPPPHARDAEADGDRPRLRLPRGRHRPGSARRRSTSRPGQQHASRSARSCFRATSATAPCG